MTRYELLYIVPTTFTDDEAGGVETKVSGLLTKYGATVESTRRLGKFRLTYPIQRQRHGHYVLVMFTTETSAVSSINEALRITPEVLRHLILRADEAGSDQKFDLIQFTEVVVEGRDERRRREKSESKDAVVKEKEADVKDAAELSEKVTVIEKTDAISDEELTQKIDKALSVDGETV